MTENSLKKKQESMRKRTGNKEQPLKQYWENWHKRYDARHPNEAQPIPEVKEKKP